MNRIIFPFSAYPLQGDTTSTPGSNTVKVTGLQGVPLHASSVANPPSGAILSYSPFVGAYIARDTSSGEITTTNFTSSSGTFNVTHGLGYNPTVAWIVLTSLGGEVAFTAPNR